MWTIAKLTAAMALGLLLAGCVALPPTTGPQVQLTFRSITAPATDGGELDRLERWYTPAATLRRAYLLQDDDRPRDAIHCLNRILFSAAQRDTTILAMARYLRARAFVACGELRRAESDRQVAASLDLDPALRARFERSLFDAPAQPVVATTPEVTATPPTILPRSAWQARNPRHAGMAKMGRVKRITIHHSGSIARSGSQRAAQAAIAAIQRYHQSNRRWADIAYHYLIDPDGRIWNGRSTRWRGAHAGDSQRNRGNIGICVLGDFTRSKQQPSSAQLASLEQLLTWLVDHHELSGTAILTHRELKVTACPGDNLQAAVSRLRGWTAPPP